MKDSENQKRPNYAEPVDASDLKLGSIYFMVGFIDDEMKIPLVETLVFLGQDIHGEGTESIYFQDAASYFDGVPSPKSDDEDGPFGKLYVSSEDNIKNIFTLDKALDVLRRSVERQK